MSSANHPKLGTYLDLGEFPSDYAAGTSHRQPEGHRWKDILVNAQLAEALGFDSVWIPDHLIFTDDQVRLEGFWECTSIWQRDGRLVSGSPAALSRFLSEFANEGTSHLIAIPSPQTPAGIEALAPVLEMFRDST